MSGLRSFLALERVLSNSMDAAALRQRVSADNIANVNTPGFRRRFVRFEDDLEQAMTGRRLAGTRTNRGHIPVGIVRSTDVKAKVETDRTTVMRNDGNNVDIDREMAINAAAELQYAALTQIVSARYKMLRSAITQGGR